VLCCVGLILLISGCAFSRPLSIQVFEHDEMIFVDKGDTISLASGEVYVVPKDGAYMSNEVIAAMGAAFRDK